MFLNCAHLKQAEFPTASFLGMRRARAFMAWHICDRERNPSQQLDVCTLVVALEAHLLPRNNLDSAARNLDAMLLTMSRGYIVVMRTNLVLVMRSSCRAFVKEDKLGERWTHVHKNLVEVCNDIAWHNLCNIQSWLITSKSRHLYLSGI
jgi:hypothetical protein